MFRSVLNADYGTKKDDSCKLQLILIVALENRKKFSFV